MGRLGKILIAGQLLLDLALPLATPAAAAGFDGEWNVRIASSRSACGNGASALFDISHGQVASSGGMVTATGRVAETGRISVMLASGIKRAVGFGHLSGRSGSGTWRGAMCSGTWTAERI